MDRQIGPQMELAMSAGLLRRVNAPRVSLCCWLNSVKLHPLQGGGKMKSNIRDVDQSPQGTH